MRIFAGFLAAAAALAAALYLHSDAKLGGSHSFTNRVTTTYIRDPGFIPQAKCRARFKRFRLTGTPPPCPATAKAVPVLNTVAVLHAHHWHASWQDPLALFVAVPESEPGSGSPSGAPVDIQVETRSGAREGAVSLGLPSRSAAAFGGDQLTK